MAKRKLLISRGDRASVPPGGRGFKCPCGGCDAIFDAAAEAIEHGRESCGVEGNGFHGRVYDDDGKTRCLWDGCGKLIAASCMFHGKWIVGRNVIHVINHEALHVKGDNALGEAVATGFVCPEEGCGFTASTAAEVWAHAAGAHETEEDKCLCLWAGCGRRFPDPSKYRGHEGVHTGIFPFNCPTCNKGFPQESHAKICCVVLAACHCGATFKGKHAKGNFATHQKRCKAGKAPLPAVQAD